MMEEEGTFVEQIFGDELDSIHKPIPVAIKDIRHMCPEEKETWVNAIVRELESLLGRETFVKLTKKKKACK